MRRLRARGGRDATETREAGHLGAWRRMAGAAGLALLAAAALASVGCAGRRAPNPFEDPGQASRSLRIEVENHNFNEATLRAVARTERRLGVVSGNGKQTFTIPWTTVDDLQIRIDILAGDRFTTNRVSVGPGETVHLTVQNPLYRSLLRR